MSKLLSCKKAQQQSIYRSVGYARRVRCMTGAWCFVCECVWPTNQSASSKWLYLCYRSQQRWLSEQQIACQT